MTDVITLPGPHGIQPLPSTVGTAEARAQRIRLGIVNYTQLLKDIADAYAQRDWATLSYHTWDEYVFVEFGEQRLQLDRARRERAVSELRSAGLSTRAIASALGVSVGTVHNDSQVFKSEHLGGEVTGADGKQYAATQPKPTPASEPDLRERCEACHNVMTADDVGEDPGFYRRCTDCDPDGDHYAPEGEPCRLCPRDPAARAEAVREVAPEYVTPIDYHQPGASPPAGGDAAVEGPAAAEPPAIPVAGGSAPPMPRPTPEALERHARERDERTSREVRSRNLTRSVWLLAEAASVTNSVDGLLAEWQPNQDIYPAPITAERMRAAADYLYALAERWPQ